MNVLFQNKTLSTGKKEHDEREREFSSCSDRSFGWCVRITLVVQVTYINPAFPARTRLTRLTHSTPDPETVETQHTTKHGPCHLITVYCNVFFYGNVPLLMEDVD